MVAPAASAIPTIAATVILTSSNFINRSPRSGGGSGSNQSRAKSRGLRPRGSEVRSKIFSHKKISYDNRKYSFYSNCRRQISWEENGCCYRPAPDTAHVNGLRHMRGEHRSLIAVRVVKPSVQRLSGDECPCRVMVLLLRARRSSPPFSA